MRLTRLLISAPRNATVKWRWRIELSTNKLKTLNYLSELENETNKQTKYLECSQSTLCGPGLLLAVYNSQTSACLLTLYMVACHAKSDAAHTCVYVYLQLAPSCSLHILERFCSPNIWTWTYGHGADIRVFLNLRTVSVEKWLKNGLSPSNLTDDLTDHESSSDRANHFRTFVCNSCKGLSDCDHASWRTCSSTACLKYFGKSLHPVGLCFVLPTTTSDDTCAWCWRRDLRLAESCMPYLYSHNRKVASMYYQQSVMSASSLVE